MAINPHWDGTSQAFVIRAKAEGVFRDFKKAMDGFRAQGMDGATAWQNAYELFPPRGEAPSGFVEPAMGVYVPSPLVPEPEPEAQDGLSVEDAANANAQGRSIAGIVAEDVQWIYLHMAVKGVKPSDAPSPGAWAWLQALRNDTMARNAFYRDTLPKFLPPAKALEAAQRFEDDGRDVLDTINKALAAAEAGTRN